MLGNFNPLTQVLHAADTIVAEYGYGKMFIDSTNCGFVATATKTVGGSTYRAEAIGRSPRHAAEQLVRVITRP